MWRTIDRWYSSKHGLPSRFVWLRSGAYRYFSVLTLAGHLALFGFVAGWGLGRFEGESWTRVIALNLLIPPCASLPFNFDTSMIQGLQTYSAKACSAVLDAIDMPHYPKETSFG